jgi:hypothetical protein
VGWGTAEILFLFVGLVKVSKQCLGNSHTQLLQFHHHQQQQQQQQALLLLLWWWCDNG